MNHVTRPSDANTPRFWKCGEVTFSSPGNGHAVCVRVPAMCPLEVGAMIQMTVHKGQRLGPGRTPYGREITEQRGPGRAQGAQESRCSPDTQPWGRDCRRRAEWVAGVDRDLSWGHTMQLQQACRGAAHTWVCKHCERQRGRLWGLSGGQRSPAGSSSFAQGQSASGTPPLGMGCTKGLIPAAPLKQ